MLQICTPEILENLWIQKCTHQNHGSQILMGTFLYLPVYRWMGTLLYLIPQNLGNIGDKKHLKPVFTIKIDEKQKS